MPRDDRFKHTRRLTKSAVATPPPAPKRPRPAPAGADDDDIDVPTRLDGPAVRQPHELQLDHFPEEEPTPPPRGRAGLAAAAASRKPSHDWHETTAPYDPRSEPAPLPKLDFDFAMDDADFTDVEDYLPEPTASGGRKKASQPPAQPEPRVAAAADKARAPTAARLSPTLARVFARRREQIGLTVAQLSKLTGIGQEELARIERAEPELRITYDHAVVLSRALGVAPSEMPGLRPRQAVKESPTAHIDEVTRWLSSGPIITFEGESGERFGGDVDRVPVTPSFAVRIGDASLAPAWSPGMLLGFVADSQPKTGDVVLLRHRRSRLLALRRLHPPAYVGLAPWQPSYVASSGEWLAVGRLVVMVPRLS